MRFLRQWRDDNLRSRDLTIDQLRIRHVKFHRLIRFSLHPYSGKWALRHHHHMSWNSGGTFGWVLSEKSRQVRTFATAEAAFKVAREFGQDSIKVDLQSPPVVLSLYDSPAVAVLAVR